MVVNEIEDGSHDDDDDDGVNGIENGGDDDISTYWILAVVQTFVARLDTLHKIDHWALTQNAVRVLLETGLVFSKISSPLNKP
ncbi:hypothetical protein PoB_005054100 [Plakobranchus ocellatus]|uniref:Uncharacterized protein n=1 Tax=Plakobranchus ocellatus TaxID=259542 RepID=A0AAV4BU67_9GAST|nr:hypothetical protein PoB_005054100 [Plakobranchus ocellatus]